MKFFCPWHVIVSCNFPKISHAVLIPLLKWLQGTSFIKVAPSARALHLENIVCGVELGNQSFIKYPEAGAGGKGGTQKGE